MVRWSQRFACAYVLTALACGLFAFAAPSTDFRVDKINLVSSVRFGRDAFDYTYTIDVTNTGPARAGVRATVTSSSPNTVIIDGSVTLGDVAPSVSLHSTDTFTFRQNRNFPFNPSDLQWTIRVRGATRKPPADDHIDASDQRA